MRIFCRVAPPRTTANPRVSSGTETRSTRGGTPAKSQTASASLRHPRGPSRFTLLFRGVDFGSAALEIFPRAMEFPTTQWSMLAQATLRGDASGREALAEFIRRYQEPVRAFICRRGAPPEEAEDLAQEFFVHVMEKTTLRRADEKRGRFRSFLLGALVRFLAQAREHHSAQKRGGGRPPLQLDGMAGQANEPSVPPADAHAYDREWAVHLLRQALATVEQEYARRGRAAEFSVLRAYLPGSPAVPAYEEVARQLGSSLGALKTDVHRLRERLRDVLRREIAATVSSPEDIDDEVTYLGRVLQSASG